MHVDREQESRASITEEYPLGRDAELYESVRRWSEVHVDLNEALEADADDETLNRLDRKRAAAFHDVARTPAVSLLGVLLKARVGANHLQHSPTLDDELEACLRSPGIGVDTMGVAIIRDLLKIEGGSKGGRASG